MLLALPLPLLPLARYRLHWQAVAVVRLPAFTGSAWRGAFSHALRQRVYMAREPTCEPCQRYASRLYPDMFETPPNPAAGQRTHYIAVQPF